jgi:hypothetical protein
MCENPSMRTRLLPALSIFAGGIVYAVLPRGPFGAYDIAARAAVTGATAAAACLLILTLRNRLERPPR